MITCLFVGCNLTKCSLRDILSTMRYAIIADIHGNLVAFTAVLQDIENRGGFDEIWCLGDVIGYGPEPHACIELLRAYNHLCVAGNHDLAAVNQIDITSFNIDAAEANKWTSGQLTEEDKEYNHRQGKVRAIVEHVFHVVKNIFRHRKTRYKGLYKNAVQVFSQFMLKKL